MKISSTFLAMMAFAFTGCLEQQRQIEEMPFVTLDRNEQSRRLSIIDRAGVPDSHLDRHVNRNPSLLSNDNKAIADFSETYLEAKEGNVRAMTSIGSQYYMGFSPVQKNYAEAVRWFAKAAEADDAQAQVYLAECYYFELGVPKDVERARALLERAKQQGKKSSRLTFSDTPISIDYNTLKPNTAPSGVSYSFTITYNATEAPQTRLFLKRYAGVYFFRNLQDRDSAAAAYSELRNKLYELDKEALNNDGTAEEQRDRFTRRMGECNTALGTFESKIRSASRR